MNLIWSYDETIRVKATKTARLGIYITPPKQVVLEVIGIYINDANGRKWTIYQYPPAGLALYLAFTDLIPVGNRIYYPSDDYLEGFQKYKGKFIVCYDDELTIETSDSGASLNVATIGVRAKLSGYALPSIRYQNAYVERHPTAYFESKIMGVIEE
jgi:hypothetical protein